jgi:muramoyltetrapeptide carboxypeptidase
MTIPPLLNSGDLVSVLSPASHTHSNAWEKGIEVLENWDLRVDRGEHYLSQHFGFGGTDAERLHDLQKALDNPEIKAIFPIRGGYGSSRLLDNLDFSNYLQNPKWIVGFSDITALLLHIDSLGVAGIHGPMPNNFCQKGGEESIQALKEILFRGSIQYTCNPHPNNVLGEAHGELIGGNLSLLTHLIGTPSFNKPFGKILVLEEIGERLYHVDRMLVQLKRAGYFEGLIGIIVGGFTDCKEAPLTIGKSVQELILEHTGGHQIPIAFEFPLGHIPTNHPVVFGAKANLLISSEKVQLTAQI